MPLMYSLETYQWMMLAYAEGMTTGDYLHIGTGVDLSKYACEGKG